MILSDEQRKQLIALRLASAGEALADAATLLDRASLRGAMNRCYYALFHAASALAIREGRTFRKHSGLISYFHEQYVKTGRLSRDLGRFFQETFENRCEADYDDVVRFSLEHLSESLQNARHFVAEVKSFLKMA